MKRTGFLIVIALAVAPCFSQSDWPTYGHDSGGMRYSPLTQITPENAANLKVAWVYHMKPANAPEIMPESRGPGGPARRSTAPTDNAAVQARAEGMRPPRRPSRFLATEVTPIVAGGLMYIPTPYSRVVALDPVTGKEAWAYTTSQGAGIPSIRGVEYWAGNSSHPAEILFGTRDGLLIALDAKTGKAAVGFGASGVVDMKTPEVMNGSTRGMGMTSPPIVYKNLVIAGSAVPESPSVGPAGDVRAWDVTTGKLVWTFHTVPRPGEKGHDTWRGDDWKGRTGVNAWGPLTVDAVRGIVYMPLGAPAYDRYGADRPGDGLFGTSLVAADANTGKLLWYFQVVHHDIWDYDLEAPPILFDVKQGKKTIPAVSIISKSGQAFFLNRVTGKPIYPIEERPVPKSDVPGEETSPTQPFTVTTPPISKQSFTIADIATAATTTAEHEAFCRALVKDNNLVFGTPFMPLPLGKTLISFPSAIGGPSWGGASFDPVLGLMYVNTQELAQLEGLIPSTGGAYPYRVGGTVTGRFWDEEKRLPCQQPPWGKLVAINVNSGKIAWQVPLGITDSFPEGKQNTGRPNLGGSIATAGGLVFIGATDDSRFRAFNAKTGAEVWATKLGAAAHSVPATYKGADGKQYVVITSAGGTFLNDPITDDSITAFTLGK